MKKIFLIAIMFLYAVSVFGMATRKDNTNISLRMTNKNNIYTYYKDMEKTKDNIFISMDVPLYTLHFVYDNLLIYIEQDYLYNAFERFLSKTDSLLLQYPKNKNTNEAIAYIEVMRSLLDTTFIPNKRVKNRVINELKNIERAKGFEDSYILRVKEDYSQYIPRGHYTKTEHLKRYFKAMMYAGRYPFYFNKDNIEVAKTALLITTVVRRDEELKTIWRNIYDMLLYMVGPADDLTPKEVYYIAEKIYGKEFDPLKVNVVPLIKECMKWEKSRIVSSFVLDTQMDKKNKSTSLKLFGQKFVPDSYIFQNLVYDKVKNFTGKNHGFTYVIGKRGFPMGLDLMALLGSDLAMTYLKEKEETAYVGYDKQYKKMKEFINKKPLYENIYTDYLDLFARILQVPSLNNVPSFMQSEIWQNRVLVSALVYWALLRHDTILYAKQSYTLKATAMRPQPHKDRKVYVEPVFEVYTKIEDITNKMIEMLAKHGFKDRYIIDNIKELNRISGMYKDISWKEIKNEDLSEKEKDFLLSSVQKMENIVKGIGTIKNENEIIKPDMDTRSVADVHTDTNSMQVLEEATGPLIEITIDINGESYIGVIPSYYEFKVSIDNRLTDEEWRNKTNNKEVLLPWWEKRFIENNSR